MNAAIWMLRYHIDESARETYVSWFHDVHIPEKLARPGYTWANHYVAPTVSTNGTREYIAMFGGTQTRVFLDPSPAQLKPRQDALTREMMQLRQQSNGVILAHEWSGGEGDATSATPVHSAALRVHWLATQNADEAIGAYAVQTLAPQLVGHEQTTRITKLIAVTHGTRHVLVEQCSAVASADANSVDDSALPQDVTHSMFAGERLWPTAN